MKMISANKLNRLWKNGVVAKMVAKTKVLKTIEEISANTNAENVAGAMAVKELKNNLTTQLSGNVRIISEGSGADAKYYAQIGADAASKKLLGSISEVTLVASKQTGTASTTVKTSYTSTDNGECVVCIAGQGFLVNTDGTELLNTKGITAGGAHHMGLAIILLNKNQSVTVSGWNNARVYRLS